MGQHQARDAIRLWNAEPESLTSVSTGINEVYRFEGPIGGCFLRLASRALPRTEVLQGVAYLRFLHEAGAPVCAPIAAADGSYVLDLLDESGAPVTASVVAEVRGVAPAAPVTDAKTLHAWGVALATMHEAGTAFQPADLDTYPTWKKLWADVLRRLRPQDTALMALAQRMTPALAALPSTADIYGVTHADCRAANVLYENHEARLIDFDAPVVQWHAADLARALMDTAYATRPTESLHAHPLLQGYRSVRPLGNAWLLAMPLLMAQKALEMLTWTRSYWPAQVALAGGNAHAWLDVLTGLALRCGDAAFRQSDAGR